MVEIRTSPLLYFILARAVFERINVLNGQGNKGQLRSWCFQGRKISAEQQVKACFLKENMRFSLPVTPGNPADMSHFKVLCSTNMSFISDEDLA